jgi:hypothetical protein
MGVLDAHVCTRSWFQAFQLYLLIQGTWIIMDWCMDGRPGRPCVHQVLVPSIPTPLTNAGDLDHNGLVYMWESWMPCHCIAWEYLGPLRTGAPVGVQDSNVNM